MPKMKTNRMMYKKSRSNAKGILSRRQAFRSHNTAKKTPKQRRQLRDLLTIDVTNLAAVRRMLPYLKKMS